MKHNFPKNTWIYCSEKHTLEQAKLFVELANKVGLPINALTLEDLCDQKYPYFLWNGETITQHNRTDFDYHTTVSLTDLFKLLNIKQPAQQMTELFLVV